MGYNVHQWNFLNKYMKKHISSYKGKWMLELGNQRLKRSVLEGLKIEDPVAKHYFRSVGFNHVSIDLNGEYDSIPINLGEKITKTDLIDKFHVITNSGTTEHVDPHTCQYEAFLNIHICGKKGSLFFHMVPELGSYIDHCQNYYTKEFFEKLSEVNNYEILSLYTDDSGDGDLVFACLRKTDDNDFCEDRDEILRYIVRKEYSKKALKKFKRMKTYRYIG